MVYSMLSTLMNRESIYDAEPVSSIMCLTRRVYDATNSERLLAYSPVLCRKCIRVLPRVCDDRIPRRKRRGISASYAEISFFSSPLDKKLGSRLPLVRIASKTLPQCRCCQVQLLAGIRQSCSKMVTILAREIPKLASSSCLGVRRCCNIQCLIRALS